MYVCMLAWAWFCRGPLESKHCGVILNVSGEEGSAKFLYFFPGIVHRDVHTEVLDNTWALHAGLVRIRAVQSNGPGWQQFRFEVSISLLSRSLEM